MTEFVDGINDHRKRISYINEAVLENNVKKLEIGLKADDVKIDEKDEEGFTTLMRAVLNNQPECIKVLLKYNAALEIGNNDGATALMLACHEGFASCIQLLLEHGEKLSFSNARTDVNFTTPYGVTALMVAALKGDLLCVRFLCDHLAVVDVQNDVGIVRY